MEGKLRHSTPVPISGVISVCLFDVVCLASSFSPALFPNDSTASRTVSLGHLVVPTSPHTTRASFLRQLGWFHEVFFSLCFLLRLPP